MTEKICSRPVKATTEIIDPEFGRIAVRRVRSQFVRVRVLAGGKLAATVPRWATLKSLRSLIDKERLGLRQQIARAPKIADYRDGQRIGRSHTLHIFTGSENSSRISGLNLNITIRPNISPTQKRELFHSAVKKALTKEAKAFLPRRLAWLAEKNHFHYDRVRFSNARSRWGSCSSRGTISLNIALMNLPIELIDYVLIHELVHTRQMNHGAGFWRDFQAILPDAKLKRKQIAKFHPFI
ncbi:MAG: M48 family metallopeptidase [Candidatus Nomurabacteria bacterium]|nr:M48 family metallopeptidase [Candidatus Nomurabacteria bacterium]